MTAPTRTYAEALADEGHEQILYLPAEGASLGYADPALETIDGRSVLVARAIGTPEERAAETLRREREQAAEALLRKREGMTCTQVQGKKALIRMGYWDAFSAWTDAARPQMTLEQLVDLDDATEWRRTTPLLAAGADALGLTPEQLDALFELAVTL